MATDERTADVVANLTAEDAELGRAAAAALESLTGGEGVDVINQPSLHYFLWYELPAKWSADHDRRSYIVGALARAFDLLGLTRYAEVCRSERTATVLAAYRGGRSAGVRAMQRAAAASGIDPPDTETLTWGRLMGSAESAAHWSTAVHLEQAVAAGDLVPGARGWKDRQREIVDAHLTIAQVTHGGRSLLDTVVAERVDQWVTGRRSATRAALIAPVIEEILDPPRRATDTTDPLPPLRWLLEQLVDGQRLTKVGNLPRAVVQDAVAQGWWDPMGKPTSEVHLPPLIEVHEVVGRAGLARKRNGVLSLTGEGKRALADPDALCRAAAGGLLPRDDFAMAMGEVALLRLLVGPPADGDELRQVAQTVAVEENWHEPKTLAPPNEGEVSWAMYETLRPMMALGLMELESGSRRRRDELTPLGRALALEALRQRAVGPKRTPWS